MDEEQTTQEVPAEGAPPGAWQDMVVRLKAGEREMILAAVACGLALLQSLIGATGGVLLTTVILLNLSLIGWHRLRPRGALDPLPRGCGHKRGQHRPDLRELRLLTTTLKGERTMMKGKRMLAAAAIGIVGVMALSGCGGAPRELVVKGLRLGVPVEEAARVMVDHGFEIGGKADPGYDDWAIREHEEAAAKHAAEYIRKVCAEQGFTDFGAYVKFAAAESGAPPTAATTFLWHVLSDEEHELYAQEITGRMARFVRVEAERLGAETLADYILLTAPPEQLQVHPSTIRTRYSYPIAEGGKLQHGLLEWFNSSNHMALGRKRELTQHLWRWLNAGAERSDGAVPLLPEGEILPDLLEVVAEQAPEGTLSLDRIEELQIKSGAADEVVGSAISNDTGITLIPEEERFPDLDTFVAERYPDGRPFHLGGPWDGTTELELERVPLSGYGFKGGTWWLGVDEERRVREIELTGAALETLFGSGDMSAEEFAATFANSYDVPLEFYADAVPPELINLAGTAFRTGWLYVNRDAGWSVSLNEHKTLTIKAATPASEQAFD